MPMSFETASEVSSEDTGLLNMQKIGTGKVTMEALRARPLSEAPKKALNKRKAAVVLAKEGEKKTQEDRAAIVRDRKVKQEMWEAEHYKRAAKKAIYAAKHADNATKAEKVKARREAECIANKEAYEARHAKNQAI